MSFMSWWACEYMSHHPIIPSSAPPGENSAAVWISSTTRLRTILSWQHGSFRTLSRAGRDLMGRCWRRHRSSSRRSAPSHGARCSSSFEPSPTGGRRALAAGGCCRASVRERLGRLCVLGCRYNCQRSARFRSAAKPMHVEPSMWAGLGPTTCHAIWWADFDGDEAAVVLKKVTHEEVTHS